MLTASSPRPRATLRGINCRKRLSSVAGCNAHHPARPTTAGRKLKPDKIFELFTGSQAAWILSCARRFDAQYAMGNPGLTSQADSIRATCGITAGSVDGKHLFDPLADDVDFDVVITVPGYPRHVAGRDNLIELFRGYGSTFFLDNCDDLRVHHSPSTSTVVLEYSSHGEVVATGYPYSNRYISVITIKDRNVIQCATTSTRCASLPHWKAARSNRTPRQRRRCWPSRCGPACR